MFKRKVEAPADAPAEQRFELMTYDELLAVKTRVDQEINARGPAELEALKEKITLIASAHGLAVADLFHDKPKAERKERKKREVKAKYRNPDDPTETWTGIGKPKKWLQAKLDAGASLEDFSVA